MSTTTATATPAVALSEAGRVVLGDISWEVYKALRDVPANRHVRMTYDDGTLELMSPLYRHEKYAGRLGKLVMAVAEVFDVLCTEARSTTLRRRGKGRKKGKGTEPDTSFYIAQEAAIRHNDEINLKRDPPPDLAIEVDETTDSESKLPIYAALGVPEVWRYDAEQGTLWFGRLEPDGEYHECDRSPGLPMLTPELVLEYLRRSEGLAETQWVKSLREWARTGQLPDQ